MNESKAMLELLPCPFCGGKAEIERQGTARQSCIIACDSCGCRLETGEVWSMGERWNTRSSSPQGDGRAVRNALEEQVLWWEEQCRLQASRIEELEAALTRPQPGGAVAGTERGETK